jgi:hypothetical protein
MFKRGLVPFWPHIFQPRLRSPFRKTIWDHGTASADCPTGCADPPEPACLCGIYSCFVAPTLPSGPRSPIVVAEIAAWGQVLIHEHGFRARHAQVVRLLADDFSPATRHYLARYYEVPVLPDFE